MQLGFLGSGEITAAMVTGLRSGGGTPQAICLSPGIDRPRRSLTGRFTDVSVASSNPDLIDRCQAVIIALKPQVVREVLLGLHFSWPEPVRFPP